MKYLSIAVYRFVALSGLPELRTTLKAKCLEWNLKGTVLLAPEGINAFVAGPQEQVILFQKFLVHEMGLLGLRYKESWSSAPPFNRMLVKIKKEIISMGHPEVEPSKSTAPYLSPQELKKWLDENRDFVLLDTRNEYEIKVGTFKKAIDLKVDSFRDFAKKSQTLPDEMKGKPVVTFCTGGIRCEKASALFQNLGFKDVYQLDGGILNYFEQCKDAHFEGNCFVFDWRLALNAKLEPAPRLDSDPMASGRHRVLE